MADPLPVSIGKGSNAARHGQGGLARFVNAYIEEMGEQGKTGFSAFAINGNEPFATLANGSGVRAMLPVDVRLLTVAGRLLFSVSAGGIVTIVGGIPSDGMVTMAANRRTPNRQTVIVCDGLWFIEEGGTLTQGSDPDLPPPVCVVESDGYLIFLIADGRWFIAGPNDAGNVDPLDFAEAESSADANVMAAVRGRTLIIFGEKSAEFWDPNGSGDFPYSRTAAKSFGCYTAGSVANLLVTRGGAVRDTVIFAGTDKSGAYAGIMMLEGYDPVIISTPEVDRLIRDEPDKASIRCMAWVEDAHPFYAISGTSFTKVWDGKTGDRASDGWHDRESMGASRWYASAVAQFADMTIFGHRTANTLHRSLPTLLSEGGNRIVWRIQPPPIHAYPKNFKIDEVQIDMITGVGLNTGIEDDDNPELVIDYSKDGGLSWAAERRASLGGMAQRKTRVKERSFGRFDHNGVTFRLTCSANVVKGLQQMTLRTTPLRT